MATNPTAADTVVEAIRIVSPTLARPLAPVAGGSATLPNSYSLINAACDNVRGIPMHIYKYNQCISITSCLALKQQRIPSKSIANIL